MKDDCIICLDISLYANLVSGAHHFFTVQRPSVNVRSAQLEIRSICQLEILKAITLIMIPTKAPSSNSIHSNHMKMKY